MVQTQARRLTRGRAGQGGQGYAIFAMGHFQPCVCMPCPHLEYKKGILVVRNTCHSSYAHRYRFGRATRGRVPPFRYELGGSPHRPYCLDPLYRRVRYILGLIIKATHESFVLVRKNAE